MSCIADIHRGSVLFLNGEGRGVDWEEMGRLGKDWEEQRGGKL